MKCTATVKGKMYGSRGDIHEVSRVCDMEMIEVGKIINGKTKEKHNYQGITTGYAAEYSILYQCEICKTIKLV